MYSRIECIINKLHFKGHAIYLKLKKIENNLVENVDNKVYNSLKV